MTFKPTHLLVAVAVGLNDDVALAEQLVDDACDLARGPGARITLLYVHLRRSAVLGIDAALMPPGAAQAMAEVWEADRAGASAALTRLAQRVESRGLPASTQLLEPLENVGEAIAMAAQRLNADLVVVTSHRRGGMKRLLLGSVAERVAHVSAVPVLLLRAAA